MTDTQGRHYTITALTVILGFFSHPQTHTHTRTFWHRHVSRSEIRQRHAKNLAGYCWMSVESRHTISHYQSKNIKNMFVPCLQMPSMRWLAGKQSGNGISVTAFVKMTFGALSRSRVAWQARLEHDKYSLAPRHWQSCGTKKLAFKTVQTVQ